MEEDYLVNTRIFSDCFASYQVNDFRDLGYILKRVNHSIWFGYGSFHTNNIEGLWPQKKRLTNNFSGISLKNINHMFQTDDEKIKYLDKWISYDLFSREFEGKIVS